VATEACQRCRPTHAVYSDASSYGPGITNYEADVVTI
jgi:hypothetical protein